MTIEELAFYGMHKPGINGLPAASRAKAIRNLVRGVPNVDQPHIDLETAWQTSVASIVEEHNQRAASSGDPVPVGPIQRWALELLRNPAALLPEGAETAYEALSVDRSRTVRSALGAIRRDLTNEVITPTVAAARIVEVVRSFGLREIDPPNP